MDALDFKSPPTLTAVNVSPALPAAAATIVGRFRFFMTIWDNRFEYLKRETWAQTTYRDFSAGLIVALTAIPMAMGLRPEQGIIADALACMIGRTFGGSKYQVYGPTAAFIPVIAALVKKYGETVTFAAIAKGHQIFSASPDKAETPPLTVSVS